MSHSLLDGNNGLPKVVLSHPSGAAAEVYLNGGHVTSWVPAGLHEMLFLSKASRFEPGESIRGGVPIVFPQFADSGPLPRHGWLRTTEWTLDKEQPDDPSQVILCTDDNDSSRAIWPHRYSANVTAAIDARSLTVQLSVTNTGDDQLAFTSALHTYLAVGDVTHAELIGLEKITYIDKTAGGASKNQRETALRVTGETDRIYLGAPSPLRFIDFERDTSIEIARSGFPHIVVWNPWEYLAGKLIDMDDDDYLRMLCVEAALVGRELRLDPGASWTGMQRLTVL